MTKQFLAALALCLAAIHAAGQSTEQPNSAAVTAAQLSAAQAVGTASQMTYQIGPDGTPVLDSQGNPVLQQNSISSMQDNLRMFQGITGIQGVQTLAGPGQTGNGGLANVNISQSFIFACSANPGNAVYGAGALAFKITSCISSANTVQSATFAICDNAVNAGSCGSPSDFNKTATVPASTFAAFNGLQLGLGCTNLSCRLTVQGSYQLGGTSQSLAAGAANAASTSTVIAGLSRVVSAPSYATTMTQMAPALTSCVQQTSTAGATGTYTTCDGKQSSTIATPTSTSNTGSGTTSATCSTTTSQCLKSAVSVSTFNKSCTRTFPVTQQVTSLQYNQSVQCDIVSFSDPSQGTSTNSCQPQGSPALDVGMTTVGATEPACAQSALVAGVSTCVATKWSEYKVNLSNYATLSVSATPAPVAGVCDTNTLSSTRTVQCNGAWFGRTIPDAQCTGLYQPGSSGPPNALGLDYTQQAGCGVCLQPQIGQTCYATPTPTSVELANGADMAGTCDGIDLSQCTMVQANPLTFSGSNGGGLVTAQTETYTCKTEASTCVQWSAPVNDPSCVTTNMAQGLDSLKSATPAAEGSLNNAMVAAALMDGTAAGVEGVQNPTVPLLFGGTAASCKRPVGGFLGSLIQKNCCRTDLQRPINGNIIQGGCSLSDVALAAAQRSGYTHYNGDYCSNSLPWPFKSCIERTQTYCSFQGILPRLIQEQGRDQLNALTLSSAGAQVQQSTLAFNYYDTAGGSWSSPMTVNGVAISAWQWPSYCSNPALAAQQLLANQSANDCPGVVGTWFAACDNPSGCGALPTQPDTGSVDWTLHSVDPLQNATTAISRYAVVQGACAPQSQSCSYNIAAWPAGVGGKAVVTKDLTWTLFDSQATATATQPASVYQLNNVGDLMFNGAPVNGAVGGTLPATVPLGFSQDGGQSWTTVDLPTNLQTSDFAIPNSSVHLTGSCSTASNTCTYRATGTVSVTAKNWPDCSGFTAGQMSMLDFSKMNLNEWLSTVMNTSNGNSPASLASQAATQFAQFNQQFQAGQVSSSAPVSANFARVVPNEGFGPFTVRLAVSGNWPEVYSDPTKNTNAVTSLNVDWGDCSVTENLQPVASAEGSGYRGTHTYNSPDSYACLGNPQANITHQITLTAYTANSGVQTQTLSVENAWSNFPGTHGNNSNVTVTTTVATPTVPVPPSTIK